MSSVIDICNKALVLVGASPITDLNAEQTEAIVCKALYAGTRNQVLEDRNWTFATARSVWVPLAEVPAFGYGKMYLIPPQVLKIQNVDAEGYVGRLDWVREGQNILTDAEAIKVRYTQEVTDPLQFSPAFTNCLSYRLAAELAMPLTENRTTLESYMQLYMQFLDDAGATDGGQGRAEQLRASILTGQR